ncbi:MAG: methionyl-tRNA formyltransferase [Propionibacteriaceae bacterium]|nr:methionyl-tRNA formyltransferase [Propionibacteriaceae bacterium]
MRLLFAGTPPVAANTLAALLTEPHQVVGVLTRPDAATGRSKALIPSAVAQLADEAGTPVLKPPSLKTEAVQSWLSTKDADLGVVVAYGGLIPAEILEIPRHGWINIHYSLLPRWRGAAPVQHAIMAGDAQTGVSIFSLVTELDAGALYGQMSVDIAGRTAGALLDDLKSQGIVLLEQVLNQISAGTAVLTPQTVDGVTYAPKITPATAQINWAASAVEIERLIRGCNPKPMAWTAVNGERFRILSAFPACEPVARTKPGEWIIGAREVKIATGNGDLVLDMVQPSGKRPMLATDWARGLRELPITSWQDKDE